MPLCGLYNDMDIIYNYLKSIRGVSMISMISVYTFSISSQWALLADLLLPPPIFQNSPHTPRVQLR